MMNKTDLPGEEWRDVPGYENGYMVSNMGRVYSFYLQGKILSPSVRSKPIAYRRYVLSKDGRAKSWYAHALVCFGFVGPRPTGFVVRHLDGDPSNNCLSNLAYGTTSENHLDKRSHGTDSVGENSSTAKLTNAQAAEIKRLIDSGEMSYRAIAKMFDVCSKTVFNIKTGRRTSDERNYRPA